MAGSSRRTILWAAGLPACSLGERIEAAAVNGFTDLSLSGGDPAALRARGTRPEDLRQRAADRGVALSILDGLTEWYPHPPPKRSLGDPVPVAEVLTAATAMGASTVNALAPYATDIPLDGLAEHFAVLCDQAADRGLNIHLEFVPFSPVDDVVKADQLMTWVNRPNCGIVFDVWHFMRVNPDLQALATMDGSRITTVQVSDGTDTFVKGLLADTFRHRLLPGEGTFPLGEVLRTLDTIGALTAAGPEVLSVELFELDVAEAARRQAEAYRRVMADAGLTW